MEYQTDVITFGTAKHFILIMMANILKTVKFPTINLTMVEMLTSFTFCTKFPARVHLAQNAESHSSQIFGYDFSGAYRFFDCGNNSRLPETLQSHLTACTNAGGRAGGVSGLAYFARLPFVLCSTFILLVFRQLWYFEKIFSTFFQKDLHS